MADDDIYVNLETLAQGAAVERFNDQWGEVLNNIKDPNTSATAKRVVTLQVELKPSEDRDRVQITINCAAKLAPPKSVESLAYLSKLDGKAVACENNPRQPTLYRDVPTAERQV